MDIKVVAYSMSNNIVVPPFRWVTKKLPQQHLYNSLQDNAAYFNRSVQ